MVDINPVDKNTVVNVNSSGSVSEIKTTTPQHYYDGLAKQWAISADKVQGLDYSSKYYAEKSRESAQNAQAYVEQVNNVKNEAITEITTTKNETIDGLFNISNTSKEEILQIEENAIKNIEEIKEDSKELIIKEAQEQLKNIESTGFYMRDDKLYFINSKGEEEEFKSGGGLEIGDIGIAPLGIDETRGKRRYLNGQIIVQDQYTIFSEKVKNAINLYPTLGCTEQEWQATALLTVGGQVGKFVIDNDAATIRLPKIIMPIQGLTDLSKLAEIVEAGLPNITGTLSGGYRDTTQYSGAFIKPSTYTDRRGDGANNTLGKASFDASLSNQIYGKSNTVQQEQIQYPYFIQVATGSETEDNIVNTLELNNPFSLLDYKYSEYELNNISWLRSQGQFNSNAIYPAVYELLVKLYNGTETKAGVTVKLNDEDFTDYDFVLNPQDNTFRLPIKVKLASGKAVVGNGMTLGMTNGTYEFGVGLSTTDYALSRRPELYGEPIGTSSTSGGSANNLSVGVTTDPTKSGLELSDNDLYLYFYVGETVQNANLVNIGRIEEIVVNKLDRSNKEEIMSWGIPDYSRGIIPSHPTSSAPFIAPADGIFVDCFYYSSETKSQLYVNGVETEIVMRTGASNRDNRSSVTVPLSKGDVIYWSTGSTNTFAIGFYPFKGSN